MRTAHIAEQSGRQRSGVGQEYVQIPPHQRMLPELRSCRVSSGQGIGAPGALSVDEK